MLTGRDRVVAGVIRTPLQPRGMFMDSEALAQTCSVHISCCGCQERKEDF